jgi:hypothetical protein
VCWEALTNRCKIPSELIVHKQRYRHQILFIELNTMWEINLTTKMYICSNLKMNGIILYLIHYKFLISACYLKLTFLNWLEVHFLFLKFFLPCLSSVSWIFVQVVQLVYLWPSMKLAEFLLFCEQNNKSVYIISSN